LVFIILQLRHVGVEDLVDPNFLVEAQKQEHVWSIGCHHGQKYDNSLFIWLLAL
jgi:hypothetical protein